MGRLLTLEEVASIFGLKEENILELVEKGIIPSYKVAGVYLRFKEDEIISLKPKIKQLYDNLNAGGSSYSPNKVTFWDKVYDFFYFYDYYIFSVIVSILLIWYVLQ